jgi:formate C-acetyltransferase
VLADTLSGVPADINWPGLLSAYKAALVRAIRAAVERGNSRDRGLAAISPAPFMSATLEGCVEKGLDKTWGGTIYNMTGLLGSELVNAANALAAIRQVVCQDGDVSLEQLRTALAGNFQGLEGERLRLRLRNLCPKFGNDDPRVDDLAAEIAELFITEGQSHRNPRGGRFMPGFFDFAGYVTQVRSLGATPDGRRAGESVSGHLAPVGGTDRRGVTANILSMSRVTRLHPPMGTMFDVKLHPSAVRGETGAEKLGGLIRAFMQLDGKALQFNVVDAATLRAAQTSPEAYSDLLVRVWGFSAYFVELSQDFQEHIINRTEHGM